MVLGPPEDEGRTKALNPDDLERWERISGVIYDMSPSPSTEHQRISGQLFIAISSFLRGTKCESFAAPFDVYLDASESGDYVIPDITVICDPLMIGENGCYGVPDLVIEILSPSTAKKDKTSKLWLYRKSEIKEYWIVDPAYQQIEVYTQESPFPTVWSKNERDKVKGGILDGLEIDLQDVFYEPQGG